MPGHRLQELRASSRRCKAGWKRGHAGVGHALLWLRCLQARLPRCLASLAGARLPHRSLPPCQAGVCASLRRNGLRGQLLIRNESFLSSAPLVSVWVFLSQANWIAG